MSAELVEASVIEEAAAPPEPTAVQLRLLPAFSPLTARFGAEFFRGLPQRPGVYLMRDERDRLIYVGKAKNLRQRLNSYRHPARASRKTVRLVHAVRRIEWELCDSDDAAQLRENALIRMHRPRFNRLGTWPKANCFILMQGAESRIRFAVTREASFLISEQTGDLDADSEIRILEVRKKPDAGMSKLTATPDASSELNGFELGPTAGEAPVVEGFSAAHLFGAFKPGAAWALASLLRLLWQALHQVKERTALPRRLLAERSPAAFDVEHPAATAWTEPLTLYFTGESSVVIDALGGSLPSPTTTFEEQARQSDLERLQHFFLVGPQRNRAFNQRRPNPAVPIGQEELDDLMVLHRLSEDAAIAREL